MTSRQLRVGRDHAELLLTGERLLAQRVPAIGELALVLGRPLLRHVMRGVGGARREVHEERLVRHQRLLLAHPVASPIGQILGEVIALLGGGGRLDRRGPVIEGRVPLIVLATDESVEGLEPAAARRPGIERPHRRGLPHRNLVALPELGGRVAVQLQCHCQRRLRVRPQRAVAGRGRRRLGDAPHPDRVVVAPAQHRGAGRGTQRSGVEAVVLQAAGCQAIRGRRRTRAAKGARSAEPDVIEEHDQDVRCTLGRQQGLDRLEGRGRVLGVVRGEPRLRAIGDRQHRPGVTIG